MSKPIEISTVKPTDKCGCSSGSPIITLHALDLINAPVSVSVHRFYHPTNQFTPLEVIDRLKASLAEAITLYPPMAGTVSANDNGEIFIALDGKGVPFHVESRETAFAGDGDDLSPRPDLFLHPPSNALAVKVTQFSCGTISIAAVLHHWISDLAGFRDFMSVWSKLARGQTIDMSAIPQDWSHSPRVFFSTHDPSQTPSTPAGYSILPTPPTDIPIFLPAEEQRWKITASSLAQLKRDFSPSPEDDDPDAWISTADALTALLWGAITRARESGKVPRISGFGRSSEASGTETIAIASDGRDRSPDRTMVGQYVGNFNVLFMTTVPRTQLLSPDAKAASYIALAIRTSLKEQLSVGAISERISFFETPQNINPPGRIVWKCDIALTNWCKFDLRGNDMDFGWGRPFDATSGGGAVPAGLIRLLKEHNTGDISIVTAVENEGSHAMKSDPLMNKYATLIQHS